MYMHVNYTAPCLLVKSPFSQWKTPIPGGQALVVALSPMLLSAPEWQQRMVQLSGCVAYILQKDGTIG